MGLEVSKGKHLEGGIDWVRVGIPRGKSTVLHALDDGKAWMQVALCLGLLMVCGIAACLGRLRNGLELRKLLLNKCTKRSIGGTGM